MRRGLSFLVLAWSFIALGSSSGLVAEAQTISAPPSPGRHAPITIRGVVLDDSLRVPVADAWLFLNDTKYGAISDEKGEFTFTFPPDWKPVRGGTLVLEVATAPWTFKPQRVRLDWRTYDPAQVLTLRLASAPGRGRPNLLGSRLMARPVPPPVYPTGRHGARP